MGWSWVGHGLVMVGHAIGWGLTMGWSCGLVVDWSWVGAMVGHGVAMVGHEVGHGLVMGRSWSVMVGHGCAMGWGVGHGCAMWVGYGLGLAIMTNHQPMAFGHSLYRLNRVRRPVGGYGEMVVAVRAAVTRCSSSRTFCGAGSSHDQAKSTLLQGQRRSEGARSAEGAHEEGFDAAWCSCFDAERAAEASGPCGQSDAA